MPRPAASKTARAKPRKAAPKTDTRQRILAATLVTLREDGIVGCSARAIARRAEVNQALLFYYYGGVEQTIIEAVGGLVTEQRERYRPQLESAVTLTDLVNVATELHHDDSRQGSMAVLVQAIAGVAHSAELSKQLGARLAPWFELIERTVVRILGDTPAAALVPAAEVSMAINSLFLGNELVATIDPELIDNERFYTALKGMAATADLMVTATPDAFRSLSGSPAPRSRRRSNPKP